MYFSHWVGIALVSPFVLLVFIGALARKAMGGRVSRDAMILVAFMVGYGSLVMLLQAPGLDEFLGWSPTKTPRLLLQALSPFLIFALVRLLPRFTTKQYYEFLRVTFYLFAGTILIEWLVVNVAGVSNTLMPGFRNSPHYYWATGRFFRPFGLTGSAPVNGSMLVVGAWMLVYSPAVRHPGRYVAATGVILLMNNSGQALLAYLLFASYYLLEKRRGLARAIVFALAASVIAWVVRSGVIAKVSLEYMLRVLDYLGLQNISAMDPLSRVMGGYSRYSAMFEDLDFTTEFYPIYALSRFGALLLVATWVYIFARLPRQRRVPLLLLLLLASVHYPTILFVELQVLLAVYLAWAPRAAATPTRTEPAVMSHVPLRPPRPVLGPA